jgi:hypothetical protein
MIKCEVCGKDTGAKNEEEAFKQKLQVGDLKTKTTRFLCPHHAKEQREKNLAQLGTQQNPSPVPDEKDPTPIADEKKATPVAGELTIEYKPIGDSVAKSLAEDLARKPSEKVATPKTGEKPSSCLGRVGHLEVKCLHNEPHMHCACGRIDACLPCIEAAKRQQNREAKNPIPKHHEKDPTPKQHEKEATPRRLHEDLESLLQQIRRRVFGDRPEKVKTTTATIVHGKEFVKKVRAACSKIVQGREELMELFPLENSDWTTFSDDYLKTLSERGTHGAKQLVDKKLETLE